MPHLPNLTARRMDAVLGVFRSRLRDRDGTRDTRRSAMTARPRRAAASVGAGQTARRTGLSLPAQTNRDATRRARTAEESSRGSSTSATFNFWTRPPITAASETCQTKEP